MSDILEQLRKERTERILRLGKAHSEMYLYCPYCAHEQTEIWEGFDLEPNGEEREGQCQKCERYFMYLVDLSFSSRRMK